MKVIFGLGNIGKEYEHTYHNVGFMVVDGVLAELGVKKSKNECSGQIFETNVNGEKVIFVKPSTYMNLSGVCVASVIKKYGAKIEDVFVVVDDFDLPAGVTRIRAKGSGGTHNGLRNIVANIGTDFARLKVGIGRPKSENADFKGFVLSKIPGKDSDFAKGIAKATACVLEYVRGSSLDSLMQKYNG
jgi:PTH1 family peptidyl-tRNA hydrolase